ncbi:DUF5996 family protein [Ramlibacter tataouinensis]|uniref:Ava_C0101 and related proteins n=1 Tax=Ramlibacter tataouinensis TaxID=94132 RepID=A0A127JQW0_9BURK|nr:DUF5996 family protein [Ramlibacter tataouinensis]AMO22370.1 hypothetical protein UC35_04980 [Ramlibacter tataouinensis]
MDSRTTAAAWPPLPLSEWEGTHAALHRWMQVIGKLRLAGTAWTNHSWHVALPLTGRGIGTGPLPCGDRFWQADFDFLDHRLQISASDGASAALPLEPQSVAQFHAGVKQALQSLGIPMDISSRPCEIPDALPFERDTELRPYDGDAVRRYWRILLQVDRVLRTFRARFRGKSSPVHFFWGAMDLAVTRFSGRAAPPHPGGVPNLADWVVREAYSHEVSSCGFWAGPGLGYPAFYAYAYPEPEGFSAAAVQPAAAFYSQSLREFILPYDAVRQAPDPQAELLLFLQSSYAAAADRGQWDRAGLECTLPPSSAIPSTAGP